MSTFIGYTIGLMVSGEKLKRPTLAKAEFDKHKDGIKITLVGGNNLSPIRRVGHVVISCEEFEDRPTDPYDSAVEAQWAFNKLGVSA